MKKKRERVKPGDILEIEAHGGFMYIQYVGEHPDYGDAILVCPRKFDVLQADKAGIFGDSYFTFYPVTAALKHELARIVGHRPAPEMPVRFRRRGAISKSGEVLTWIIEDNGQDFVKKMLTKEEQALPRASIFNHQFLIDRIAEGWRPEWDFNPPARRPAPPTPSVPPAQTEPPEAPQGEIRHFLYFPAKKKAREVAAELRKRGFHTEDRLGGDGENWLVLASHTLNSAEEISTTREMLEELAEKAGGEYDGWEAAANQ